MFVSLGGGNEPATLVWMSRDGVNQAILVAVADDGPAASPDASASPSAGPSKTPPEATSKPTKKP